MYSFFKTHAKSTGYVLSVYHYENYEKKENLLPPYRNMITENSHYVFSWIDFWEVITPHYGYIMILALSTGNLLLHEYLHQLSRSQALPWGHRQAVSQGCHLLKAERFISKALFTHGWHTGSGFWEETSVSPKLVVFLLIQSLKNFTSLLGILSDFIPLGKNLTHKFEKALLYLQSLGRLLRDNPASYIEALIVWQNASFSTTLNLLRSWWR